MDLRYALRLLRAHPAFAAAVVLTLALGIGANTIVFSVLNVVLVKPLPYPAPDRIVLLMSAWQGRQSFPRVSAPKFNEWRRSTDALLDAAAYRIGGVANLTDADQPEQLTVGRVSERFFRPLWRERLPRPPLQRRRRPAGRPPRRGCERRLLAPPAGRISWNRSTQCRSVMFVRRCCRC